MQYLSYLLLGLVVALQAADAYLTWRIIQGGGRELNPVVRFLITKAGTAPGLAIDKVFVVVMAGLFLLELPLVLLAIAVLYAWVVWHNWKQFRKGAQK